jgi:hypothetical protein
MALMLIFGFRFCDHLRARRYFVPAYLRDSQTMRSIRKQLKPQPGRAVKANARWPSRCGMV